MMKVTTFLKNQRKERLSRRLDELKEDSAYYLLMSNYFLACAETSGNFSSSYRLPNFYPYSSFLGMHYCVDFYSGFYNEYLCFLFRHNRAETKIENLEKKLEDL